MFLVCKLQNNTIISPCDYPVRNLQLLFLSLGENDLLFLKMLYNLVAFLLLHVKLVHVTTAAVMFYKVTENTMLANTESLLIEKIQG